MTIGRLALSIALTAMVSTGALAGESPADPEVGEFTIRPILPLPEAALAALRAIVATDEEAAGIAKAALVDGDAALSVQPRPLAIIHYEGLVNTDPRRIAAVEALRTLDQVAALLRAWQVSNKPEYAAVLLHHVEAWATTYQITGNDVNENKLVPLLIAWAAVRAQAEPAVRERVDAWVADMGARHAKAVAESQHLTNRYTKHVRLAVYCGLAIAREEWVQLGRVGVERFVRESLRADGSSLDLERRDSLTYHCSGLVPALDLALLLGSDGPSHYTWTAPDGGSLQESVLFVVPYATGEKTHAEWVHTTVDLDRRRAAAGLEKYRAGRLFDPIDAANLLEAASAFEPTLVSIWAKVTGSTAERYGSWRILLQSAMRKAQLPEAP